MKTTWSFTPFSGLKKALKKIPERPAVPRPVREAKERSDEDIFDEEMAQVKEIREFRVLEPKAPPKPSPGKTPREDPALRELRETVSGNVKIRLSNTGEYVQWTCPGIRKDLASSLHEGRFAVQDTIDLHGMTLAEAEGAVRDFISGSVRGGLFCVKVIHGRGLRSPGGPVLKEALLVWLEGTLRKHTAAYATAQGCDGGLGATYVILKRR